MSFLHVPLITVGSLLIGIPIVLHLLMRRKPKLMVFPALRFVKSRQQINQQKMKLRHLMLLLLRCAIVAALAAALARPFVPSPSLGNWLLILGLAATTALVGGMAGVAWTEPGKRRIAMVLSLLAGAAFVGLLLAFMHVQANPTTVLVGDNEPPVAAALIIDRSPRMGYLHENVTRLQKAKSLAAWLLDQLPADSDIAILDSVTPRAAFSVDQQTAATAIESLEVGYQSAPLPNVVNHAAALLAESGHQRKEIYIFTDLTQRSWASTQDDLAERLAALGEDLSTYVVDVGIEQPANLTLHPPTLSSTYISPRAVVDVSTLVEGGRVTGPVALELVMEIPDPTLPMIVNGKPVLPSTETRGRSMVNLSGEGAVEASFSVRGLPIGVHHGQIRTQQPDGLMVDNVRYFTIRVGDPWRVLLISAEDTYSEFISGAIAPMGDEGVGPSMFVCDVMPVEEVDFGTINSYAAVALVDPGPISQRAWNGLAAYVEQGGGLAILLGRNASPISEFNSVGALSVLPGRLLRQFRSPGHNMLSLSAAAHPMLSVLKSRASSIAWNQFPVFRHWELDELKQSAITVMSFTNGLPAIIESTLGAGRIITVTTPFTDPLNVPGREPWNLLPTGPEPWPYVVLVNELFHYLVSDGETSLNYTVGDVANLDLPTAEATFQMFSPQGTWQPLTPQQQRLVVPSTSVPGVYRIRSSEQPDRQIGFSVNLPAEETDMERIPKQQLDALLGTNYRIATDEETIVRDMSEVRRGREFYPWLMLFLAVALGLESLLGNRFYAGPLRDESSSHESS